MCVCRCMNVWKGRSGGQFVSLVRLYMSLVGRQTRQSQLITHNQRAEVGKGIPKYEIQNEISFFSLHAHIILLALMLAVFFFLFFLKIGINFWSFNSLSPPLLMIERAIQKKKKNGNKNRRVNVSTLVNLKFDMFASPKSYANEKHTPRSSLKILPKIKVKPVFFQEYEIDCGFVCYFRDLPTTLSILVPSSQPVLLSVKLWTSWRKTTDAIEEELFSCSEIGALIKLIGWVFCDES